MFPIQGNKDYNKIKLLNTIRNKNFNHKLCDSIFKAPD